MLDGDEVPSAELLGALPQLVADESVAQIRLGRRWCFPDARHWLAERPWWPDYQVRLVRPGSNLDFDLRVHGGARRDLPARYADESIYHLACLLSTFAERRRRVRRYEAERPGLVAVGGGPMNDTLYVPEHFATLRPMAVPPEDAEVSARCSRIRRQRPAARPRRPIRLGRGDLDLPPLRSAPGAGVPGQPPRRRARPAQRAGQQHVHDGRVDE